MNDPTPPPPRLSPAAGERVEIRFDGEFMSWDGGALARLGVERRLAARLVDPRNGAQITHGLADVVGFGLPMVAAGHEQGVDANALRVKILPRADSHVERIVARVEVGSEGQDTRCVVANLPRRNARALFENRHCRRGQAESHIKSVKAHLAGARTCYTKAAANQFRLLLGKPQSPGGARRSPVARNTRNGARRAPAPFCRPLRSDEVELVGDQRG